MEWRLLFVIAVPGAAACSSWAGGQSV